MVTFQLHQLPVIFQLLRSSSTVNISTPSSSMAFSNFSTPSSSTADNISPPSSATVVNIAETPTVVNNTSTSSSMSPTAIPHSSNMISKYLIQYVPATVEKKKTASTRVTGLHVLTSVEGLAILTEKKEKKKQEKEEKEKRKKERLDKRREKQELVKKKAEEKASKSRNERKIYHPKEPNVSNRTIRLYVVQSRLQHHKTPLRLKH